MSMKFISNLTEDSDVRIGIAYRAHFHTRHYSNELFEVMRIPFPAALENAVQKRRSEYLAGRYLAKLALRDWAVFGFEVTADENRCPVWPPGLIGSISHTDSVAMCSVASSSTTGTLGIDIESWMDPDVRSSVEGQIATRTELDRMLALGLSREQCLTSVFSAKESIFKALYPWARRYFDFTAAELVGIDNRACLMIFRIIEDLGPLIAKGLSVTVSYRITAGTITTCASLPRIDSDTAPCSPSGQ